MRGDFQIIYVGKDPGGPTNRAEIKAARWELKRRMNQGGEEHYKLEVHSLCSKGSSTDWEMKFLRL